MELTSLIESKGRLEPATPMTVHHPLLSRVFLASFLAVTAQLPVTGTASAQSTADEAGKPETPALLSDLETRGNIALSVTHFTSEADHSATQENNASISGEVDLYLPLSDDDQSIVFTPFARLDEHDSKRTHVDIRELLYQHIGDEREFRIGLGKIFWGVAESRNPVDVVNQRDNVEGFSSDAKLGQPLVQLSWFRDNGSLDLFVLPGFHERTFAGPNGRPRASVQIDPDQVRYERSEGNRHVDFAARYSTAIEEWDLGFSAFHGTTRDPLLEPVFGSSFSDITLRPFYYQISQIGFDAQATLESWLLKFEWIHQQADEVDNHMEFVSGFEYSFYGLGESDADLGVISEYLYDNRGSNATQPFQNDLLLGFRLALNDEASSEALIGTIVDLDSDAVVLTAEASRRIGNSFKLSLEAAAWLNTSDDAGLDLFRNEDYLQAEIAWFF